MRTKSLSITDKIVSALAYFSFGFFSLIWIIYANVTKKHMSPFLLFNLYQAIFISVLLAIFAYIYDIFINLFVAIPYIGKYVKLADIFLNGTPLYFSFTITGLLITFFVGYLVVFSLLGIRPNLPFVSDIIKTNIGE